jgi:hypothetical protein
MEQAAAETAPTLRCPPKKNRGFRRFLLRGMEKVTLEVGRLSLAHNLLKQAANDQKQRAATLQ